MATYDLAYPGAAIDAILNTAYYLQEAGFIFRGSASDYAGTPSKREWVIAPAGFTGYGISSPVPKGSIGICLYNGTSWVGKIIEVVSIDSSVNGSSTNPVSGSAVYSAINQLATGVAEALDNLTFTDTTPSADQDDQIKLKVSTTDAGVERILTYITLLTATTSKAGLMSAEDKAKVDSFLTNLRSLTFADTTASADQATQITETLKATIGGVQEVIDSITLLAATSSKAGLLSASDKAYIDALPAALTNLSNSISAALALMESLVGYYTCDTAAATAAKTVTATGYTLTNGGCIRIKMTNANTAANVTLNINSTGAKALYYDGAQASSTNTWEAGEVLEVYYDGTQYQCASGGGGGKFATGQKVKDTGITNTIAEGSDALPTSGAVSNAIGMKVYEAYDADLDVADESGNVIMRLKNGHVQTKNFNSEYALGTIRVEDVPDADLDFSDNYGNVIMRLKGGNIQTKNFNSREVKQIKILFIGNSLTQDAVAYVPLLLKEIAPEMSFKLYDWYNAGQNLNQQYTNYFLTGTVAKIFSVFDSEQNTGWTNYNDEKNIDWVINNCDFDIIVLQEYSYYSFAEADEITYYNNIVNFFQDRYSKSLKYASFIDAPNRSTVDAMFNRAKQYAAWHMKSTDCQSIVAPGAAIYYALQTDLASLGDRGGLSPDGTHAQEGLPCLLESYVIAMWIFEQLGIPKSIVNSKTRMKLSVYNSLNVPGANLGTGLITGTDAQHAIAQQCAIMADKLSKGIELNVLSNF